MQTRFQGQRRLRRGGEDRRKAIAGKMGDEAAARVNALHERLKDSVHHLRQLLRARLLVLHQLFGDGREAGDIYKQTGGLKLPGELRPSGVVEDEVRHEGAHEKN